LQRGLIQLGFLYLPMCKALLAPADSIRGGVIAWEGMNLKGVELAEMRNPDAIAAGPGTRWRPREPV